MKKQITFLAVQIITLTTLNAQSIDNIRKDSIDKYKFGYEMIKSNFNKPLYHYTYENIDNQKEFGKIELSKSEMESVFDTLQANSSIRIDKTKYGVNINLSAKFPNNFNHKDLWRIGRVEIVNHKLYDHLSKKLELYKFGCTNFRKLRPEYINGKAVPNNPMYTEFQTRLKDTADVDSLSYGTVEYEIAFVSGYDKIHLTKSDISKSFKLNNDSVKLVDIFDNKVVLEEINNKTCCTNIQLLNTNTIGRKATTKSEPLVYDSIIKAYKEPIIYAKEGNLTLPKEIYLLFRNNPQVTLEEDILMEKTIEKAIEINKNYTKYIILTSPAPINSSFIIYSPNYGFRRQFIVKLKNKVRQQLK